jgi:hypothetical protein
MASCKTAVTPASETEKSVRTAIFQLDLDIFYLRVCIRHCSTVPAIFNCRKYVTNLMYYIIYEHQIRLM